MDVEEGPGPGRLGALLAENVVPLGAQLGLPLVLCLHDLGLHGLWAHGSLLGVVWSGEDLLEYSHASGNAVGGKFHDPRRIHGPGRGCAVGVPGRLGTPLLTSRRNAPGQGARAEPTHGPPRQPRGRRLPRRGAVAGSRPTSSGTSPTPGALGRAGSPARGPRAPDGLGAASSGSDGWTCVGWPVEYGRPGRLDVPAGHLERGVRPGRCPGPGQRHGGGPARPHPDRLRDRRPETPVPQSHPDWGPSSGARATPSPTPARTSPTSRPRRSATATSGSSPARRSGPPTPSGPTGASSSVRTDPDAAAPQGPLLSSRPHGPARDRGPAHPPDHRDARSSTRSSSTGPAPTPTWSWAR